MSHTDSLAGKNVVVTGAAQGVGLGIVEELLGQDASVVMLDRDAETLSAIVISRECKILFGFFLLSGSATLVG